jgi:aspartyl-tRNA(Asn)/glutamyl-tRNA(Gln) amidotransferase subunit A
MSTSAATAALLDDRAITATAATNIFLAAIQRLNPQLNCYLHVDHDGALAAAAASDQRRREGRSLGPLDGIAVAVKANIAVKGWPVSAGFAYRAGQIAASDATIITRLRAAGAVFLGATNMDEAALGASTNNVHFGACHNPLGADFTAGGSSGGSACAIRSGLATVALGSDTMGSVRIPASYCGVVGLKPSFDLLPMAGVVPLCPDLDHLGFLVRHARDMTDLLTVSAGMTVPTAPMPRRLGVLRLADCVDLEPAVAAGFETALQHAVQAGCQLIELDRGGYDPVTTRRAGFLIAERALFEWLSAQGHTSAELSPGLRRMVDYGARQSAARLAAARQQLSDTASAARRWFTECDVVISPTTPQCAFRLDGPVPDSQADFTVIGNLTGWPAISIPVAAGGDALPVGVQLMAPAGQDDLLVRLAESLQSPEPLQLPRIG